MPLFVFEGADGTGKTTQLDLACHWLQAQRHSVVCTREPGGTPLAESIRKIFKELPEHGDLPEPATELMLVMAARAQHVAKLIRPALARNEVILCDRFLDSSYVFQGMLGGLSKNYIDTVAREIVGQIVPEITLIFTADVASARRRMNPRATQVSTTDRLDNFSVETHSKILEGFERLVKSNLPYPFGQVPRRHLINTVRSIDEIHEEVVSILQTVLKEPASLTEIRS